MTDGSRSGAPAPEVLGAKDGLWLVKDPAAARGPLRVIHGHRVADVARQAAHDERQQHPDAESNAVLGYR